MDTGVFLRPNEIHISNLEENMIIIQEVINEQGVVLVPKGFVIRNLKRFKDLLLVHDIYTVFARLPEEEPIPEEEISTHSLKIREFVENFEEKRESLKLEFEKIIRGDNVQEKDLRKKIRNTLEVFEEDINIFQLIQKVKDLDDITYAHAHNVTLITYSIGKWLDLNQDDLKDLSLAALLIDIGKIKLPESLLHKKEKLTNDEWLQLQSHAILSYELIKDYDFLSKKIKDAVLLHHEKMDGSGYPMGFKGDKIPLFAKIISIADVYSALTSQRSYRSKKTPFEAIKILETQFIGKLDTNILYLFLNRIGDYFVGQKVRLNSGEIAKIMFMPKRNIYRPIVQLEDGSTLLDLGAKENEEIEIEEFV